MAAKGFLSPSLIVHFMRHAESEHRPRGCEQADSEMRDPSLNEAGRQQCVDVKELLHELGHPRFIDHILASPLTRTLETALLALKGVTDRGIKVLAVPELQSLHSGPNGTGLDVKELRTRYGNGEKPEEAVEGHSFKGKIDFSCMSDYWNRKSDDKWKRKKCDWRVSYVKGFLRALAASKRGKSTEVFIVSHSSFIEKLLNMDWNTFCSVFPEGMLACATYHLGSDGEFEEMNPRWLANTRDLKTSIAYSRGSNTFSLTKIERSMTGYTATYEHRVTREELRSRRKHDNKTLSMPIIAPAVTAPRIPGVSATTVGSHKLHKQNRSFPRSFCKAEMRISLEIASEGKTFLCCP